MGIAGHFYSSVMSLRNYAFDKDLIKSIKFNKPIISVGNLSMGGTGKTPMVALLIESFQEKGLKVGVVSRGYGGRYKGVDKVKPGAITQYGDEMSMLNERYPDTPIYVCKKRTVAIKELIAKEAVDIVIADDAFQHRYFKRDVDVVLMDSTDARLGVFPSGRLRESLEGLKRADFVVITRSNEINKEGLYQKISPYLKEENIFWAKTTVSNIYSFSGVVAEPLKSSPIVLLSGVGNPESFEKTAKSFSVDFDSHKIFRDHYSYKQDDILKIESANPEASILCTEKDFIKLKNLKLKNKYYYIKINTEILGGSNEFISKVWTSLN